MTVHIELGDGMWFNGDGQVKDFHFTTKQFDCPTGHSYTLRVGENVKTAPCPSHPDVWGSVSLPPKIDQSQS